mmetsp:Transcript_17765/g.44714  ORF Transcript_17765/g.44714 Transcript_17765/m.44714 type:complete len:83 (-) Transcript_17765:641-889(-)
MVAVMRELFDAKGVVLADQWVLRVDSDEFLDRDSDADITNLVGVRMPAVCQDYFKLAIADRVSATGELVGIQAEDRADSLFK